MKRSYIKRTPNKKRKLTLQADRLWFNALIKSQCEVCGARAIQVHHFYYKGSYGHLRYDLDNGISICQGCHFVLHNQDPKKIEERIIEKRGQKWLNNLKKKSQERPTGYQTIAWYNQNINDLTTKNK